MSIDRPLPPPSAPLFSDRTIAVTTADGAVMAAVAEAVEAAVALPGYREAALARAPLPALAAPGPRGVFLGYDYHLSPAGPRLVEINTNAGGALLNAMRLPERAALEAAFLAMFRNEWALGNGGRPLGRIAIVDDGPQQQFLYGEFLAFRDLFASAGLTAAIAAPEELQWDGGRLRHDGQPLDLIYNRLTDFTLAAPRHAALRRAWLAGAVVLTPHPHAHALYADKRNLALLGDRERLLDWGLPAGAAALLATVIPTTLAVTPERAEGLWRERRRWYFKPARGYGSRGAYAGARLTRRVWEEIVAAGDYVAQEEVPPPRLPEAEGGFRYDLRCYAYDGAIQLRAARLYRGQTTNFRTPGGGFGRVVTAPAAGGAGYEER